MLKGPTKFYEFLSDYSLIITDAFDAHNQELALLKPNGQNGRNHTFETVYAMLNNGDNHEQKFYSNVQGLKDADPMDPENNETKKLINQINILFHNELNYEFQKNDITSRVPVFKKLDINGKNKIQLMKEYVAYIVTKDPRWMKSLEGEVLLKELWNKDPSYDQSAGKRRKRRKTRRRRKSKKSRKSRRKSKKSRRRRRRRR